MTEAAFTRPATEPNDGSLPPELQRFLHRLPTAMARRLTAEELSAYAKALTTQRSPHWIDFRASIPLFGSGFYVALMVGRERRARERLRREGQLGWVPNLIMASVVPITAVLAWLAAELLMRGLELMATGDHGVWWRG